jgi:hypothetical protein
MTDALFFDTEEYLSVKLERDPTYEEVIDYLNSIYKENNYERKLLHKKNKIQDVF